MNLTTLDLTVAILPLMAILIVTWYMQRQMRSVTDFLAANRCAGRFIICTAVAETGAVITVMISELEIFSKAGFSLQYWNQFAWTLTFLMGITGLITVRYRETRSLTFHQFFEKRYSKGVRVFGSAMHAFSGLFFFGVQPAISARFFVYFCGIPDSFTVGGMAIATFIPVMLIFMAMSLYYALSGGQISVMVADCLDGLISTFFYLLVAGAILLSITQTQVQEALLNAQAGQSYLDPFDIGGRKDFDTWYVVLGMLWAIYVFRGSAWNQGFIAAARTPHEGRMAQILSVWRSRTYVTMTVLISIGCFVVINHPDFAPQRVELAAQAASIESPHVANQMRMPLALGSLLGTGVKGAFLFILISGVLASQANQLHSYGSTIMQDVILPWKKRPLSPARHILALRMTMFGVGIFEVVFSALFKPVDYLVMISILIGSIYLGGVGVVVWGGLYWKRGTAAGAWTALVSAAVLGTGFNLMQQFWGNLQPFITSLLSQGALLDWLAVHQDRSPLNGQQLSLITAAVSIIGYITVSLLTCKEPHNMDALLNRGIYRVAEDNEKGAAGVAIKRSWLARFLNIDEHFTRGDKVITYFTFFWSMLWKVVALLILLWVLFFGNLSDNWWFHYNMITSVWITMFWGLAMGVIFTWGVTRDLRAMFVALKIASRNHDAGLVTDGTKPSE